jgi:hypothetical protein
MRNTRERNTDLVNGAYRLPALVEISTTLWLEWFDNDDGYWDDNAAEYRRLVDDPMSTMVKEGNEC